MGSSVFLVLRFTVSQGPVLPVHFYQADQQILGPQPGRCFENLCTIRAIWM